MGGTGPGGASGAGPGGAGGTGPGGAGGSGPGGAAGAGPGGAAGTGPGGTGGTAGQGGSGGTSGASCVTSYPPPPYGRNVGDVIANLQWEGYVSNTGGPNVNTQPYVNPYSMDDVRQSGRSYALVHLAEFW